MKKIILLAMLLMAFSVNAYAVDYVTVHQAMVSWPAALAADGVTRIPENQISYNVWLASKTADPNHKTPILIAGSRNGEGIKEKNFLVTIGSNAEGQYDVGVSAIRVASGVKINESEITWSNIKGTPDPWGLQYFILIGAPAGISTER